MKNIKKNQVAIIKKHIQYKKKKTMKINIRHFENIIQFKCVFRINYKRIQEKKEDRK